MHTDHDFVSQQKKIIRIFMFSFFKSLLTSSPEFNGVKNLIFFNQKNKTLHLHQDNQKLSNDTTDKPQKFQNNTITDPIVKRFLDLFKGLGAAKNDIIEILGKEFNITYSDLNNPSQLLKRMSPELLEWCSNIFGINDDWLKNGHMPIYRHIWFYKDIYNFFKYIKILKACYPYEFKILALATHKQISGRLYPYDQPLNKFQYEKPYNRFQKVGFIIAIPTGIEIRQRTLMRYIPVRGEPWDYWRSRYQLKTIFWLCSRSSIQIDGSFVSQEELNQLESGDLFTSKIPSKIRKPIDWYPDNYCSDNYPSDQETEEWPRVYNYIKEQKYDQILDFQPYPNFDKVYIKKYDSAELILQCIKHTDYSKLKKFELYASHMSEEEQEKMRAIAAVLQSKGYRKILTPQKIKAILNCVKDKNATDLSH